MRRLLTAALLGLCAIGAHAQTAIDDRSGEAALACLQRPAAPKYPDKELERRTSGFYRVLLTFTQARRAPEVKVLFAAGSVNLQSATEQYVKQFRLPCLKADSVVTLVQEVRFTAVADADAEVPQPLNLPRTADGRLGDCLRTPAEGPRLSEASQMLSFQRELRNGNLVVELSFTAPDKQPKAEVLYNTLNRRHRDDVLGYVEQYRVPCLGDGESFQVRQTFHVDFGNRSFAFKDVGLAKFLGMVRNVDARPVDFNLDTMGCPFRVRFELGRPAIRNRVTESGMNNPNRRAFIAWLEELELALTPEQFENLLGAEMLIDVPCGTIKLG